MTVSLTVLADSAGDLEALWREVKHCGRAEVDLVDGEVRLTVDLRSRDELVLVAGPGAAEFVDGSAPGSVASDVVVTDTSAGAAEPAPGTERPADDEETPTDELDESDEPEVAAPVPFRRDRATYQPGQVARLRDDVLVELRANPGVMSAADLADELNQPREAVMPVLRALAADGLVRQAGVKGWKATASEDVAS
jgi:hypothetical protein